MVTMGSDLSRDEQGSAKNQVQRNPTVSATKSRHIPQLAAAKSEIKSGEED